MKWYPASPAEQLSLAAVQLRPGQVWRFQVKLKPPRGLVNPVGFDYERWLFSRNIAAIATIKDLPGKVQPIAQHWSIDVWRDQLSRQVQQVAQGRVAKALLPALLVGDRRGVTEQDWLLMQQTGIAHLMAISGMHITLLAFIAYGLANFFYQSCRYPPLWLSRQVFASSLAAACAVFYALLAGLQISTLRAVLMIACVLLARLLRWRIDIWHSLLLAGAILLTLNPLSGLDPGLWLSFVAVGIILWVLAKQPMPRGWRLFLQIQLHITLGLLPLTWFLFGSSSIISPVVNLIMIPVVEWCVVPVLLLWSVLPQFLPGVDALMWLVSQILDIAWQLLAVGVTLQANAWQVELPPLSFAGLLLCYAVWFVAQLPAPWPGRYMILLLLLPVLWPRTQSPLAQSALLPYLVKPKSSVKLQTGEWQATVLDVGQGLAVVLRTAQHLLVYDTGNARGRFDAGKDILVPYLQQISWQHWATWSPQPVDRLLLSHQDQDHAGGLNGVLENYPVRWVFSLLPAQQPAERSALCQQGMRWSWDGVKFEILYPLANTPPVRNLSCVLRVQGRPHSLLLTGDIERDMEFNLLDHYSLDNQGNDKLRTDVLLVPHHGSKTSSTTAFLARTQPQQAIISAGFCNRYGHPHSQVMQRYQNYLNQSHSDQSHPMRIWNTASAGAIDVISARSELTVQAARLGWQPWWRDDSIDACLR